MPKTTDTNNGEPKINIFKKALYNIQYKLSDSQKSLLALGLTGLIVVVIGGGVFISRNPNFIDNIQGKKTDKADQSSDQDRPVLQSTADSVNKALSKIGTDAVIYQTISFEELPIYPQAWVDKYFDNKEQANALIGGQDADPDADGLSNKQEYLYGSDPTNKDSLCEGRIDNNTCVGRTDKQNVDAGISPLTGLQLDTPRKIKIKKQDLAVIGNLKNSLETASSEGVDFPTLYQLAKTIDLTEEMNKQKVISIQDTAQGFLDYQQFRVEILGDFADDDEFSSFTKIYELSTKEDFDTYIKKYTDIRDKLAAASVPQKYIQAHRAYILLFQKLVNLVEHRKDGVLAGSIGPAFKEKSKKISTEMVWSYKRLNEELTNIAAQNQSGN